MKKTSLSTVETMKTLAWVLPMPMWSPVVLASQAFRQTYTLCNQSNAPIKIEKFELSPNDDDRLTIVGGSCYRGMVLAPKAMCTINVQLNPFSLGTIKHLLSVEHAGQFSPLWTEILLSVNERGQVEGKGSYLAEDTDTMARQRRLIEQDGHRRYARVHARSHPEQDQPQPQMAAEGELQNNILQNPWLNSQRFDGVDPNLNPEPPLNSVARAEFDNERREQEMEKQLRLGNMPKMSSAPKPQGF